MAMPWSSNGPVLPMYSATAAAASGVGALLSSPQKDNRFSLWATLQSFVRTVVQSQSTRNVFFFLLLNLSFASVEVVYGVWTNSLGLIGDGVHMYFDSSAILFGLIAAYVAKWPATDRFSYGYGRVEAFAGFINTLALAYAALNIFYEAVARLLDPPSVKTDDLLTVSFLGLLVNLLGIFAFEHGGHGHSHGGGGGGHSHAHGAHDGECEDEGPRKNPLMQGMFLHVLADTMGSVAVIVSALLIDNFGWHWSDPLCSLFLSILIFASIFPVLKDSGLILLQRCPPSVEAQLPTAFQKVLAINGVVGYTEPHFWESSSEKFVGSLRVQIMHDADDQRVRLLVASIFKRLRVDNFVVQVEKTG